MKVEVRSNEVTITGYVNVPERKSRVMPSIRGKFTESINGGVFQRALDKADEVKLLFNHNAKRELGSTKSNLVLKEDEIGLHATATIQDEEVRQLAMNNKLTGWSFGFVSRSDSWSDGENGIKHRTIDELDLLEVSVLSVTPAYYSTKVEARGMDEEELIEHRATDEVKVEIEEATEEVQQVNSEDDVEEEVIVDDEQSEEEQRLFSCKHKHYVDTFLRLSKEKGQY